MSVSACTTIHANQHQHRVQRNRGKSVGGHPVDCTRIIQCDDGYTGPKTSQGLAEISGGNSHVLKVVPRAAWENASRLIPGNSCIIFESVERLSPRCRYPSTSHSPAILLAIYCAFRMRSCRYC